MGRKGISLSLIVVILAIAGQANAEGYEIGARTDSDSYHQTYSLQSSGGGRYSGPDGNLDEMRIYNGPNGKTITLLKVTDNGGNCAKIVPINGGPGSSFVVMHITATMGCHVDFEIEMYAK